MLDAATAAHVVRFSVGLLVLFLSARFLLIPTLTEVYRQRLFDLRRKLFALRLDGHVAPNDPAYVLLTHRLNALIRFAESVTFGRLFVVAMNLGHKEFSEPTQVDRAIEMTSDAVRAQMESIRNIVNYETIRHVLRTSMLGWLFLPVQLAVRAVRWTRVKAYAFGVRVSAWPSVERLQVDVSSLLNDASLPAYG